MQYMPATSQEKENCVITLSNQEIYTANITIFQVAIHCKHDLVLHHLNVGKTTNAAE